MFVVVFLVDTLAVGRVRHGDVNIVSAFIANEVAA